jgi:phosphotransferase system enzyme I (PtsP)
MAFAALGFRRLSMPASGVGPVKRLVLSLDVSATAQAMKRMMQSHAPTIRGELTEFAKGRGCAL